MSLTQYPNVAFYQNKAPSRAASGRTGFHHEILQWNDIALEREHCFIQWLFPNREEYWGKGAGVNSEAYNFSPEEAKVFRSSWELKNNVLESFYRMLKFYGLKCIKGRSKQKINEKMTEDKYLRATFSVVKEDNFVERQANMDRNTHNYRRVTRIMNCLCDIGLDKFAKAFYDFYASGEVRFPKMTLQMWEESLLRQLSSNL